MKELHRTPRAALMTTALLFSAMFALPGLVGCGDDDDGPNDPPPLEAEDFTETAAVNQTLPTVNLINATLDAIPGYANGVGAKVGDDAFTYDATDRRWEAESTYDAAGYAWEVAIYVQYLNEGGLPEEDVEDATQMRYGYSGTAHYNAGGVTVHQTHDGLLSVTGLGGAPSDTLTVIGGGEYTMDYTRPENGSAVTTRHDAVWDIDNDGISLPGTGCPLGEVVAGFDPFELFVNYDGSSTVSYNLLDGDADPVAEGTGTTTMSCGL
jgi:hypothetical protein